jgi:uncharacterized protein YdhG (YjbR/CyaY superfamily)
MNNDLPIPKTIDDYLSTLPTDRQVALQKLRNTILSVVPQAVECISYQIPTFKYHGSLVGFASFKNHLGFYVMSTTLLKNYETELKGIQYEASTIRFTPEKPLPVSLVKKLVKERKLQNEMRAEAKKLKKK